MTHKIVEPFIRLKNVKKIYGTGASQHLAVSNVTMDINAGELISIVGPSGCGKSTILMIIAGLTTHEDGVVEIGNEANPFNASKDIGMVFQQSLLLRWRNVLENILFPAEILGLPMKASKERALDLINLVGLDGYANKFPKQLSGGQQQRVSIARSLIHDPKLILMDEPFGALDALTREKMNIELLRIWEQSKKTILFVTHGISEAVLLGSRVAVLSAGPARMAANIPVELPYPRTLEMKTHEEFGEYCRQIYNLLGMD